MLWVRRLVSGWSLSILLKHASYYSSQKCMWFVITAGLWACCISWKIRFGFWRRQAGCVPMKSQIEETLFTGCQKSEQRTRGARPGSLDGVWSLLSWRFQFRNRWACCSLSNSSAGSHSDFFQLLAYFPNQGGNWLACCIAIISWAAVYVFIL